MFNVELEKYDRELILKLVGMLDLSTIDILEESVENISSISKLVLDLSRLEFIDSTGIGSIIKLMYSSHEQGFDLEIINLDNSLMELFDSVGVLSVLKAIQR